MKYIIAQYLENGFIQGFRVYDEYTGEINNEAYEYVLNNSHNYYGIRITDLGLKYPGYNYIATIENNMIYGGNSIVVLGKVIEDKRASYLVIRADGVKKRLSQFDIFNLIELDQVMNTSKSIKRLMLKDGPMKVYNKTEIIDKTLDKNTNNDWELNTLNVGNIGSYTSEKDLNNIAKWVKTHKLEYVITAHVPPIGTKVYNKLEQSNYVTDNDHCVVLTGLVGEQWVTGIKRLCSVYTYEDGTKINEDDIRRVLNPNGIAPFKVRTTKGEKNWAMFVPVTHRFSVDTSWGTVLQVNAQGVYHGDGDYIVCSDKGGKPNLANKWVVNGEIFKLTYDMKEFK